MRRLRTLLLCCLLVPAACGSDDAVEVDGAWSRANPLTETPGVVYFDLTVPDDDRLVGASVPADVAGRAEIHEVVTSGEMDGGMSEGSHDTDGAEHGDPEDTDDMEMSAGSHDMDDMGDMDDMDDMEDMDGAGGMMSMREMDDGLALTGGETVAFEPGSYHVMLIDLADPLDVGEEFELTLDFETADPVTVTVGVADEAP